MKTHHFIKTRIKGPYAPCGVIIDPVGITATNSHRRVRVDGVSHAAAARRMADALASLDARWSGPLAGVRTAPGEMLWVPLDMAQRA